MKKSPAATGKTRDDIAVRIKPLPPNPKLEKLIEEAKKRWAEMSPEQQEAELRLQRLSWARQDMD